MKDLIKYIIEQAPEFGVALTEGEEPNKRQEIEAEVADKLQRAAKIDDVDTVTFGLESDDGKIVKVFVDKEDADKFETIMADLLGEEDSIEDAINRAAEDVNIIDVEWPADDGEEDADEDDADDEDDGSDVLDKDVYDKAALNKEVDNATSPKAKPAPAVESLTMGERLTIKLNESPTQGKSSSMATRLTTSNQQLVYQAILDLGMPEIALERSPYRSAIVKGIKNMAIELQNNSSLRTALKMFVRRSIDDDHKHHDKEHHDKHHDAKHHDSSKVDEALLTEASGIDVFWSVLNGLMELVDPALAADVMKLSVYTTLSQRARPNLQRSVAGTLRTKMTQLQLALGQAHTGMAEALLPEQVPEFMGRLVMLADPQVGKQLINTSQMKRLLARAKNAAARIPATVKMRIEAVLAELDKVVEDKEEPAPTADPVELLGGPPRVNAETWSVEPTKVGVALVSDSGKQHEFADEDLERMLKGLSNRETVTVKTVEGVKMIVSPRGRAAQVKQVGSGGDKIELTPPDVEAVIDAASQSIEDE